MTTTEMIYVLLFGIVVLPVVTYMVAKFATYGILKARWRFHQEHPEGDGCEHDNKSTNGL